MHKALVLPNFTYCSTVWQKGNVTYVDKLYKLQKGQHKLLLTQAAKLEVWVSSKPCIENQLKTLLPDASK